MRSRNLLIGLGIILVLVLVAAWRLASARNVFAAVAPVVVPGCGYLLLVAWGLRHDLANGILSNAPFDKRVWRYEAASLIALAAGAAWGIVRAGRARSAVAQLVVDLGRSPRPGALRDALADGLGDQSLRLAFRRAAGNGYVDADGRTTDITPAGGQAVTPVVRGGREVAMLIHDHDLVDDPDLVEEVLAAAHIAIENERLQAEVSAQLDDLRRSRARIVIAGDAERTKLERDLHDGAQQRIVGLSLGLQLLRSQLDSAASPELSARVLEAEAQVRDALAALREVAHGIHPAVLTDEGLAAAVEALVEDTERGRVDVARLPDERFPPATEAAAYFVIAEAVKATNGHVTIELRRHDGKLIALVRLADSDIAANDGRRALLVELADRVGAIDGRLDFRRNGSASILRAEIPCE